MSDPTVQQKAIEWLVRLQTAQDIESHWSDFEAWLDEDPDHSNAYAAVERIWSDLEFLKEVVRRQENRSPKALTRAMIRESKRRRVSAAARIAGLALLGGGVMTLLMRLVQPPVDEQSWVLYERGADQVTPVTLGDGSSVQLNDNTHIRVGTRGRTREVLLDNGEAYFEVNRPTDGPFDVNAGSVIIRSRDAAFTVKREGDGHIEAVVRRGKVEITPNERDHTSAATRYPLPREVLQGQIATVSPSSRLDVAVIHQSELDNHLTWTSNVGASDAAHTEDRASPPHDPPELPVTGSLDDAHLTNPYQADLLNQATGSVN